MRASVLGVIVTLIGLSEAAAQSRRPDGEEWVQVRPLFKLVEEVAQGNASATAGLTWQCHFIDAEAGVVFVPFTVQAPPGSLSTFPVAMYLRVVLRGAPAPAPGPTDALAQYPFEDAAMFVSAPDNRYSRAFVAPPGEYDVYVALREKTHHDGTPGETLALKRSVSVPDLKSGLAISSIIVSEKVEPDPNPIRLDFETQLDQPYVWWGTRLTPALRDSFHRTEQLSLLFAIYNAGIAVTDKPDVVVDYKLHRASSAGDALVSRAPPEFFNATTLPGAFRVGRGDLLVAGRQIPMAHLPDGNYRLEVTVIDRTSGQTLTRDVHFVVNGP